MTFLLEFRLKRALTVGAAVLFATAAGAQQKPPGTAKGGQAAKASQAPTPALEYTVEPKAMSVLKAASQKLAAAKTMSFTADVGYEYPSKFGPPILYSVRYDVVMQRPDKLRVVVPGDGPASQFFYDGKTMTAYVPHANLAAIVDAPPTMEDALKAAYQKAAIYFPFSDLLVPDPYVALSDGAILAFYIGTSNEVGGTKTDMVAWANNDVFVQAWIGSEDKLPRRLRAVFRADPLQLRHDLEISGWQLDRAVSPDTFVSRQAQTAGKMAFAAPSPPPKGSKPIIMGK